MVVKRPNHHHHHHPKNNLNPIRSIDYNIIMKSTLLLIIGIVPLSLLTIVNLIATFGGDSLSPISPVPTEMVNLSASTADTKQSAEDSAAYLFEVDISLAKKDVLPSNSALDLNEITRDVLQYVKLRKSLEGIWDVHLRQEAAARLDTTVLNTLLKQYKTLSYEGLNSENGKKYREYVELETNSLEEMLGTSAEYDQEVKKWIKAESAFKTGDFAPALQLLSAVDMQIILKFKPPIVTVSRMADLKKACEYNIALKVIVAEQVSLRNTLKTLLSSDVVDFLNSVDRFERDYPVVPVEAEPKLYEQLQMDKKAFTLFNELLVLEISNDPADWGGELQKLMNDITQLREFGDEFSTPMLEKQQGNLVGKLQLLAQGQALAAPAELNLFQCLYYMPRSGILFARNFIKNKTGYLVDNEIKPPLWFYKENKLPLIPFSILDSEVDLRKLAGEKQEVVKELLNETNKAQESPLVGFYEKYNKQIVNLEAEPKNIALWFELLKYITEERVFLVNYKSIGGGYEEVVDERLNSLESVAERIVEVRLEIEHFLQQ